MRTQAGDTEAPGLSWSATASRIFDTLATLALLVTITFFLAHAAPGGPAYAILGLHATPDATGAVNLQLGLNVPIWRQYLVWWAHLLRGDLGTSYLLNRPVASVIAGHAPVTAGLALLAIGAGTPVAVALGTLHGMAFTGWPGRALGLAETTLYALPAFFTGTVLIAVFSTGLGWLPAGGDTDLHLPHPTPGDTLRHLILPAATLALIQYATLAPYAARAMHSELRLPYVRTARAKGAGPARIILLHVLPRAIRPVITMLGLTLPLFLAGNVVVESLFGVPGLGWLLWQSALSHDVPVLTGLVLLAGVATIAGNLAASLINVWLDPRLRHE